MFAKKLREAMQELNLNQTQLSAMTGKCKASISQYLSGTQTPSERVQEEIAISLGLEPDYFQSDNSPVALSRKAMKDGVIPRLDVNVAASMLRMNPATVRKGLQQRVFPWGYAIKTSDRWSYFINARRFALIEGVDIEKEDEK